MMENMVLKGTLKRVLRIMWESASLDEIASPNPPLYGNLEPGTREYIVAEKV